MRILSFIALFCIIAYALANINPEDKFPHVLDLEKAPENPSHPFFVEYYSPHCGWCRRVAKTIKTLGGVFRDSNVKIGKIDCSKHHEACEKAGVEGYPTFHLYQTEDGKTRKNDYAGHRTIEDFAEFIKRNVGEEKVGPIRDLERRIFDRKTLERFIDNSNNFKIVAVTADWCGHCKKLYPILKALNGELIGTSFPIEVVTADGTKQEIKDLIKERHQEVKGFPTIIFFNREGKPEAYTGARTLTGFITFLRDKTGYDIPIPDEEPAIPQQEQPGQPNLDTAFLAAKYYENLARIGIENARLVKEVQLQLDEALLLLRSVANVELPEPLLKRIDERKAEREREQREIEKIENRNNPKKEL